MLAKRVAKQSLSLPLPLPPFNRQRFDFDFSSGFSHTLKFIRHLELVRLIFHVS